jgi:hypothetical protein
MPGKNSPEENAREESGASRLSEVALERVLRDSIVKKGLQATPKSSTFGSISRCLFFHRSTP